MIESQRWDSVFEEEHGNIVPIRHRKGFWSKYRGKISKIHVDLDTRIISKRRSQASTTESAPRKTRLPAIGA